MKCYAEYFSSACSTNELIFLIDLSRTIDPDLLLKVINCPENVRAANSRLAVKATQNDESFVHYYSHQVITGQQLMICSPIIDVISEQEANSKVAGLAVLLRLTLGDQVARQMNYNCVYKLSDGEWLNVLTSHSLAFQPYFLFNDLASAADDRMHEGFRLNKAAIEFLRICVPELDLKTRFMLRWTALEAQLSDWPGENSGQRRVKFFGEDVGSHAINCEVRRLHTLRGRLFKEGEWRLLRPADEFSMSCALRLTTLEDCGLRRSLISAYEARIPHITDVENMKYFGADYVNIFTSAPKGQR